MKKIKICVFLICIMACFCGYAFASGKGTGRVQEKMHLVYQEVMQSDLDSGTKALVVLSLLPAFERNRAVSDFKHIDWPWDDDDEEDEDDEDDEDDGNEFTCLYEAITTMITEVEDCDSDFACILLNVSTMVVEIASCTE